MSTTTHNSDCQTILAHITKHCSAFETLITNELKRFDQCLQLNLSPSQLALCAARWGKIRRRKILMLDASIPNAQDLYMLVKAWNSLLSVNHHWHIISEPMTDQERSGDIHTDLSAAMHHLLSPASPKHHFVIPSSMVQSSLPDLTAYHHHTTNITIGERMRLCKLIARLVDCGYVRSRTSTEPGSIHVRGESIDIAHPALSGKVTITFLGNSIESIVQTTDRRSTALSSIKLPPVSFPAETASWHNILSSSLLFRPNHDRNLIGAHTIITDSLHPQYEFPITEHKEYHGKATDLKPTFVFYSNKDRVTSYFNNHTVSPAAVCKHAIANIPIHLKTPNWTVVTERSLFPHEEHRTALPVSYERALELIGNLEEGKPAVHTDHGIGIFEGLQQRTIEGQEKEYLVLRYAQGDALSVPVEYAYKVTPYIGEQSPPIYRLGGTLWANVRKRAHEDAARFAKELLTTARKRAASNRSPHIIDRSLEQSLDKTFPFELTDDQKRTLEEVLADLCDQHPMDRLVVGDVGFGKTEIAVRAAMHVVNSGKQVAVLAPTTLLVQQHVDTFRQRLPGLAQQICLLSRFISSRQQKDTRAAIAAGNAKIAIGTHALLSSKTQWNNLGLVIIDEEQRFGVRQKEHLKQIRASVDILSLSATPIPRTLSMALSGLRSLSMINTPPRGRKNIRTTVKRLDNDLLAKVIHRELDRGGKIYIVAPKIRHLHSIYKHIGSLVREARMAVAHGQLPDTTLSGIIHQFDAGNTDILISSSIVEHGLDLPNVNTMIVWHAPQFGLADLYQLRGRIGRRQKRGYAYFLYNQDRLTPIQRKRLAALTQASRLGSGWHIARRDLEIRGAGNLLGSEQSGSVNAVGVQMYLDMIRNAADQQPIANENDVDIELPIPATIPTHYIDDADERTRWYQRLARACTSKQLAHHIQQLEQKFGHMPRQTCNLVLLIRLQRAASRIGITKISSKSITPPDEKRYWRIEIEAKDTPRTLRTLNPLGNWAVRDKCMTLDVDEVTPALVRKMADSCEENSKVKIQNAKLQRKDQNFVKQF